MYEHSDMGLIIKVSVIVPVYGVEYFIGRCAHSLFKQTMSDGIEYIFVNDCTKDRSIEILEKIIDEYPQRKPYVKVIHHQVNKQLAAARNTGLDNATGEFICMVDSDDFVNVDIIQTLYKKAIDTNSDIVFSNSFRQFKNKTIEYRTKKRNNKEEYLVDILDRTSQTAWWGRLYKRSLFEENGIRINPTMESFGEDYSTVPRLFYFAKKVELVEECLYHYVCFNPNAHTKNIYNAKQVDNMVKTLKLVDDFFKDKEQMYKDAVEVGKLKTNLIHAAYFRGVTMRKKGFNTFPQVNCSKYYSHLNPYYKLIYILASNNLFRVLHFMKIGYYFIFKRN